MTSIVLVCLLELPLEYVIQTSAVTKHITAAAAFALSSVMTSCILFLPKAITILLPDAPVVDTKAGPSAKNHMSSKKQIVGAMHKIISGKGSARDEEADAAKNGISLEAYKKLTPDEKVALCNEQIIMWRGRLMQANDVDSHQSSQTVHGARSDTAVAPSHKPSPSDKPPVHVGGGTHEHEHVDGWAKPAYNVPNGTDTSNDVQVFNLEK